MDGDPTNKSREFNYPHEVVELLQKNPDGSPQSVEIGIDDRLYDAASEVVDEVNALGINGTPIAKLESEGEVFYVVTQQRHDVSNNGVWTVFDSDHGAVRGQSKTRDASVRNVQFDPLHGKPVAVVHSKQTRRGPELSLRSVTMPGYPLFVGRDSKDLKKKSMQFDLDENTGISRDHFSIDKTTDGRILINVTSSNPTELTYMKRGDYFGNFEDDNIAPGDTEEVIGDSNEIGVEKRQGLLGKLRRPFGKSASKDAAPVPTTEPEIKHTEVISVDPDGKDPSKKTIYRDYSGDY